MPDFAECECPAAVLAMDAVSEILCDEVRQEGNEHARAIGMTITIYGIKNCDTMKKARTWLDEHGVVYSFHDYKVEGIAKEKLKGWSDELGWETLLNRAGTTFRKLPDSDKEGLNERKALALMLAQPSMIKRPVLDLGGRRLVGFKPDIYAREVAPGRAARGKSSSAKA
jgi:arsenate reductase (glutaredoxin)